MKLINKKDILDSVVDRYKTAYPRDRELWGGKRSGDILSQLQALDVMTESDAKRIIGNDSWTSLRCNECEQEVNAVVQLGEEPDYESRTACICFDCLEKAMQLKSQILNFGL